MDQPDNLPDHTTKIMVVVSIFCVILMVCTFFSYFIVVEGQSALRLQLGQVVLDKNNVAEKYKPGVHLMIPFINQVKYFNTKLRTLNYDIANTYTEDKYPINVDYFVTWRINDLGKYYTSTGADSDVTSDIIRQQVGTALQKNIGLSKLEDVVNKRREHLMTDTTGDASKQLQKYGIKLEDFRLNRIELNNSSTRVGIIRYILFDDFIQRQIHHVIRCAFIAIHHNIGSLAKGLLHCIKIQTLHRHISHFILLIIGASTPIIRIIQSIETLHITRGFIHYPCAIRFSFVS